MVNETNPPELSAEALERAAGCLRVLAHPARLHMVELLLQGSYTVGALAEACGIPGAQASAHLGKMRDRGLLSCARHGREMHYSVEEALLAGIMDCMRRRFGVSQPDSRSADPGTPAASRRQAGREDES